MDKSAQQAFQGAVIHARIEELERTLVPVSVDDLPPPEVAGFRIEGRPELAMRVVWVSEDRHTAVLIEKCGPCRIVGAHFTEVFYFLSGHCTFQGSDGSVLEAKGGDFVCFTEGQTGEATVHETFLKCSMYHASRPLPYEVTP